jgi:hypothetical protein
VNTRCIALLLLAALAIAPRWGLGADNEVASVLGGSITRDELAGARSGTAEPDKLYDLLWRAVSTHFVAHNGLAATAGEVAELEAYDREFERRDRRQRARKLEEIEQRLAAAALDENEWRRLEEFRAVLARMAQREAESGVEPQAAPYALWVEEWKLNRALYERYGGVVALTRIGQYPHGARVALLEDYERRGLLRFSDADLRRRLFERLARQPPLVVAPGDVDFTPYWKRPIPFSYFPD